MNHTEALVLPPRNPATASVRIGGRSLCERAIVALRRAGIERIVLSLDCGLGRAMRRRLARLGIPVQRRGSAGGAAIDGNQLVVVSADVVFEPAAVGVLVGKLAGRNASVVVAADASPGTFAAVAPGAGGALGGMSSDREILDSFDAIPVTSLGGTFCSAIAKPDEAAAVSYRYAGRHGGVRGALARLTRTFGMR